METEAIECVYFIHAEGTNLVKVGWTRDLSGRFRQLKTASPHPLILLAIHPGSSDVEALYHRDLAPYRQRGEWFFLTSEVRRWLMLFLRDRFSQEWHRIWKEDRALFANRPDYSGSDLQQHLGTSMMCFNVDGTTYGI
jgi:hypothetical protein